MPSSATASADPIPAITESDASGAIRDIYQDIKQLTGVDVVNLVWRRLAITDGALPAVWSMVRPVYASGDLLAQGVAFRQQFSPPALATLPKSILTAAGVDQLGLLSIRAILDSYNHTNAINLIALSAVLARLGDVETAAGGLAVPSAAKQETLPALPPLPALAALDPHVREVVERLNELCEQDGRVIASMYRHLAYWPGYLALIWTLLEPLAADGRMQASIDEARAQAGAQACKVASELQPCANNLEQSVIDDIRDVLTLFTQHPISKMAAICAALSSATPVP